MENQWCSVNYGFGLEIAAYEAEKEASRLRQVLRDGGTVEFVEWPLEYRSFLQGILDGTVSDFEPIEQKIALELKDQLALNPINLS